MIDSDLIDKLIALETAAGDRVYPGNPPQNPTLPLVIVSRVSDAADRVLSGEVIRRRGTWRFDVYGRNYDEVYGVSAAISTGLDGFRGVMGTTSVLFARRDSFGPDLSEVDGDKTLRHLPSEFSFAYQEN